MVVNAIGYTILTLQMQYEAADKEIYQTYELYFRGYR